MNVFIMKLFSSVSHEIESKHKDRLTLTVMAVSTRLLDKKKSDATILPWSQPLPINLNELLNILLIIKNKSSQFSDPPGPVHNVAERFCFVFGGTDGRTYGHPV